MKHIDYPIVPKSHTPMYLMHKYWARKPHNVVAEYIKNYTKEGDIVLDPFCGSGPTPIEAIKLGRKAVAIDLDPIATFITRMTAMPVDISKIESTFEEIKKNCKEDIEELYKTKCEKCGKEAIVLATIWDRAKRDPIELRYYCEKCNGRNTKQADKGDLRLLKKIENQDIDFWYPTAKLAYNSKEFKEGTHDPDVKSVDKLYTKRNLIALSFLYNQIDSIQDFKIRELFKFAFTSMSHLASKMCPVAKPGGRGHWSEYSATSFWSQHRYYLPKISMESNVWMLFDSAINGKQGIIKGKIDSNNQIEKYKEAKKFDDLNNGANIFIENYNAIELTDIIPENSVDYVFTDPPYGGAIQYFELSELWASWLRGPTNDKNFELKFKDEITINPAQKKDFDYYHAMLKAAFDQVYKVIKPGKWMTVTFHSTDIRIWNSIIKAVVLAGFDLEKIVYQPPPRASAKGLLQPYGSAVGDYYIRFRKPTKRKLSSTVDIDEARYEKIVVEAAKRIIAERGEPTIYQHILNGIIIELQKENALLLGKRKIEDVMRSHINKEFVLIPVKKDEKVIGNKWWFKDPSSIPYLERVSLFDRVEKVIVEELKNKVKVSFDDILQSVFIKFPNALTPETQDIKSILEEYAEKAKGGKWRLKPEIKVRIGEHGKMTYYLFELGRKMGYDVWVAPGIGSIYNGESLYEKNDKNVFFRFIPSDYQEKVKQIDVLWYKDGKIEYEFEIENTTSITEAITRGSYIPYDVKRFIVIPKERENLLVKKLEQPIIKENVEKHGWNFISYPDLENLFKKKKRKKKLSPEILTEIITSEPKISSQIQANLSDFEK